MRSQGNLKAEMLQSYNLQSSYQPKGQTIIQKNSRNVQNLSSQNYPSMMSPPSNYSHIYQTSYTNQVKSGGVEQARITTPQQAKSLSLTSSMQYNKLGNSMETSTPQSQSSSSHLQNAMGGGMSNAYQYTKPSSYGNGNYNTIDHTQSTESNQLYNGYRSQSKKVSSVASSNNQSAQTIAAYGGLINNMNGNGGVSQQQQYQMSTKTPNYLFQENSSLLQLPKLQGGNEGTILTNRQMNGSNSEKASLRSPVIDYDNTIGQRKPEPNSKNNLRNIVKYYNTPMQQSNNPYSSPLQQQIATSSRENQPQQQLVSLSSKKRLSNTTNSVAPSNNISQNNATVATNSTPNSQNQTQNYYNMPSGHPHSSNNTKKDVSLGNQYSSYSSQGKNLNSLSSPVASANQSKLQQTQQSILSPNSKSQRQQNSETPLKTPLKVIQPSQSTGYSQIFNNNQQQVSNKVTTQNLAQNNNDFLDIRMLPKIDKSKISTKQIGVVHAYGANTHQGLIRGYNEDRVSIILNMVKPPEKSNVTDWPNISFFAIYDGHGGAQCADFLRDQLHFYIVKDEEFPKNPQKAIHNGFVKTEEAFLKIADSQVPLDKSGSCAIVVMLINEVIYVANLGDSRAVLSQNNGSKVIGLTVDHKPNHPDEEKRILANGGKIYQSQIPTMQPKQYPQFIKGPHRVLPGRLAVSRTMGDAEAKIKKYGGNSKVILCEPEITSLGLSSEHDFIMLGCDGIFDKLTNNQSIDFIWDSIRETQKKKEFRQNLHEYVGDGIYNLIKQTLIYKSFDNLTVVMICFKSLEKLLQAC